MITVQIMDVFASGGNRERTFAVRNLVLWGIGFGLYRLAIWLDWPCGSTIPVVAILAVLCWAVFRYGKKAM